MAEKKLYLRVEPAPDPDFDSWCYPINTEDKSWDSILENIKNSLDYSFIDNEEKLEGMELTIKIEMVDPDEIIDTSER